MGFDISDENTGSEDIKPQPVDRRHEILHALTTGLEITVNGTDTPLTITEIRPNAAGGEQKELTAESPNGTIHAITITYDKTTPPTLTTIDSTQQSPGQETNAQEVEVLRIDPGPETILPETETTARDIYGPAITDVSISPEDTYPESRVDTPELQADELTIIGDCPQCSCLVVESDGRAICTSCGAWAPAAQWRAYHETTEAEQGTGKRTTIESSPVTHEQTDLSSFTG